jgi:hypothetical protein
VCDASGCPRVGAAWRCFWRFAVPGSDRVEYWPIAEDILESILLPELDERPLRERTFEEDRVHGGILESSGNGKAHIEMTNR